MVRTYKPVTERNRAAVDKYNANMRLRRMKKRLESGKVPFPKKHTPGAAELVAFFGLKEQVIIPHPGGDASITKKARVKASNARRPKFRNVKFKGEG